MVFSDVELKEDVRICENLVVGCLVGKRFPFLMVKHTVHRIWKLKGELQIALHGDRVFVFYFDSDEDINTVLEHGCLFIRDQLFVVRPWTPMIEKELAELKSVHVWLKMRDVPLHLWNARGLGKLARFVGVPLMMDK